MITQQQRMSYLANYGDWRCIPCRSGVNPKGHAEQGGLCFTCGGVMVSCESLIQMDLFGGGA